MAVLDDDVVAAVRIPAISVLGGVVVRAATSNVDVAEDDIGAVDDEVVLLRAVAELEVGNGAALQANGAEQDGPQDVDVLGIQVVPHLAIAVEGAAAVDVDVLASELEEGGRILENLLEGIGLPVMSVVCELDSSLDI